jgi:hypothetical protein
MASRPGKMPTTPVRRRISFFQAFLGVVGPDLVPDLAGEGGEGQQVVAGAVQMCCGLGKFASRACTTCRCWVCTEAAPGCSKIVRTRVATQGWRTWGTWVARFPE